MPAPPFITVTVRQVRPGAQPGQQFFTVTNGGDREEICRHLFRYPAEALSQLAPPWPSGSAAPAPRTALGRAAHPAPAERLAAWGRHLHEMLFGDGQQLRAYLSRHEVEDRQTSITLALQGNATPLWDLPWELLHDGEDFLALSGRFLLNRAVAETSPLALMPESLPLRLLVTVAAPAGEAQPNVDAEIAGLLTGIESPLRDGRLRLLVVDDATPSGIGEALQRFQPHVWHHIGHGQRLWPEGWNTLTLVDERGDVHPADLGELHTLHQMARGLRLLFLAGCHAVPTRGAEAFGGLGLGLIQDGLPAVLLAQSHLAPEAAQTLNGALYAALADGHSVDQAIGRARVALRGACNGAASDWAAPVLVQRAPAMRVIAADARSSQSGLPPMALDQDGLAAPGQFVGRAGELRALQQALADERVRSLFLWGDAGVGKSSLVARLLQAPASAVEASLVIPCARVDPLEIPARLARFLEGQELPGHKQAAALLLNQRRDVRERTLEATSLIAGRRYAFVFDGLEQEMATGATAGLVGALLRADWRSFCLFTGRQRWPGLEDELQQDHAASLHVEPLPPRQALLLASSLPRLRSESVPARQRLVERLSGHPLALELAAGWLDGQEMAGLDSLLGADPQPPPQALSLLVGDLLARLTPDVATALARLSVLRLPIDAGHLALAGLDLAAVHRLLTLALLQRVRQRSESRYLVPGVVREAVLAAQPPDEQRALHGWAADACAGHFVAAARRETEETDADWSEAQIVRRARREVLLSAVSQTARMAEAQAAMDLALEWLHHLGAAGETETARDVAIAIWSTLDHWGQTERAMMLLGQYA